MTAHTPIRSASGLDPITVEVLGSAFSSIAEEMGEALVRASHSANIKERRDCSCACSIATATRCARPSTSRSTSAASSASSAHRQAHGIADLRPGDVFIGNDAYEGGGTHLPDIVLAEPIFFENELIGWAINTAHHSDFADRGHAHIYQEGLRIPPVRLYRAGELQADVQELILLNCQVPDERLSDLMAQMAANRLGVRRMQALCAKYGVDKVWPPAWRCRTMPSSDARRHRADPRWQLQLRGLVRSSRDDRGDKAFGHRDGLRRRPCARLR
jgi:N-methylhydantoinase B